MSERFTPTARGPNFYVWDNETQEFAEDTYRYPSHAIALAVCNFLMHDESATALSAKGQPR